MRTLAVLVLLLSAGLAGCIGNDAEDLGSEADEDLVDPLAAVGTSRLMPVSSFEPTIGVTSSGALFVTGGNTSAGPAHQTLFRSTDQGLTWEDVTMNIAGVTNYPPNSNDPYVYVDKDTDRVFDFEMQGLSCNMLAYSDDEAETWEARPLGCTPTQGIQDHQTIFSAYPRAVNGVTPPTVGYEKVLYYCVNRVVDSGCSASYDSGLTWGPFRPLIYQGINPMEDGIICGGLHAHGAAHPDGTIYLPRDYCGTPTVAISEDNALNWEVVTISDKIDAANHEVTIGVDDEGNVFAAWLGDEDHHVYVAASYDKGYTWTEAIDVTGEGIGKTYFPVITAAGDGNVAIAYIGSTTSPDVAFSEFEHDDTWNAYITVGYGLNQSLANGTWETVQTNPENDPIARGVCPPGRCQAGGGGLGDFIDIEIDVEGRPWGAFVDVCHAACARGTDANGNEVGNNFALGMVSTLDTGKPLRGDATSLPPLMSAVGDAAPQPASTQAPPLADL